MTKMKNLAIGALLVVALGGLSGCAAKEGAPVEKSDLQWVNTDLGAVQCLVREDYGFNTTTSCAWSTLQAGKTHEGAGHRDGKYVDTKLGRVYCLDNSTYGFNSQYDCNWNQAD